jgi:prepilin-type processing-associated H-X9-DG protein
VQVGLDNVKSLGEKTSIQDQQFVTRTLLRTDGAPHGLLTALIQPAVDDSLLKCVPPDAMALVSFRLDLGKTYDQLKAASVAIGGNDASKTFGDFEQQAKEAGVPVQEVLAPLGDQWVGYTARSTGGMSLTGWTMISTLKDPAGFNRQVDLIAKLALGHNGDNQQITRRQYVVDGVTIHYLAFGGMFEFFTPAWAQVGDKLVVAIFPQIVEDAVKQLSADKSILDNPEFQATRKLTGHDGPALYVSGPEIVKDLYPFLIIYVQFIREMAMSFNTNGPAGAGATAELIPSMQRLLQYIGSDGVNVKVTPDGILRTKSVANPLLSPFTLTDNIPLLVALAIPSMREAQTTAARVKSASQLRQIGQGLILYANDNKGSYPPDFATLRKTQDLTDEVFKSPDGTAKNGPDYVYLVFPGMKNDVAADTAVAYDAAELEAGEGANFLYGDGHVDFLHAAAATAEIEKAKKAHPDIIEPAKQKNGGKVVPEAPAVDAPPAK